jgi:hypothetical protein
MVGRLAMDIKLKSTYNNHETRPVVVITARNISPSIFHTLLIFLPVLSRCLARAYKDQSYLWSDQKSDDV